MGQSRINQRLLGMTITWAVLRLRRSFRSKTPLPSRARRSEVSIQESLQLGPGDRPLVTGDFRAITEEDQR